MYVALKRIRIGDRYREPGESVPEAAEFRNLGALIRSRFIVEVHAQDGQDEVQETSIIVSEPEQSGELETASKRAKGGAKS